MPCHSTPPDGGANSYYFWKHISRNFARLHIIADDLPTNNKL